MSVIRARRLGLCLLVVVLLLSVTVSASDSTVVLDETQFNTIWNEFDNIEADLERIIPNVMNLPQIERHLFYLNETLNDALFHGTGDDQRSIATMLYSIEYFCVQFNRLLPAIETDLANIDDALRMTITNSNGTSTTYDMASIVYNHIGDKLDSISSGIDFFKRAFDGQQITYLTTQIRAQTVSLQNISSNSNSIVSFLSDIHDFFTNEEDLETKETSKEEQQTFNSEFGSKSRTDEMTKLSGLSTGMTDWFDLPDVDITSMFDQVESGYGRWFTSETAQAISVGGGSAAVAAAAGIAVVSDTEYVEPDTPYLDAWDQEVKDILAGGDGEW